MDTWLVAKALLEILSDAFEAAERPHDRRYCSDGGVLFDWTPLLAVEWERNEPAWAGDAGEGGLNPSVMSGGFLVLRAIYTIHCTRDSPFSDEGGTPPVPRAIEESGEVVHADARLIIDTLLSKMSDHSLLGQCGRMEFLAQNAVGPDGGVVGSVTAIAIPL